MGACGSSNKATSEVLDSSRARTYSLHENLVRERTGRLQFNRIYDVLEEIGHGGLCTIKRIRKKDESIGGSAHKVIKGNSFRRLAPEGFQRGRNKRESKTQSNVEVLFALKVINLVLVKGDKIDQLKNEVEILKSLDHKNIIKAYETFSFRESRTLEIVMELCTGGDLHARMPYTEASAANVLKQVFSAISYVHCREIIHRDIKFENIMFESKHPQAAIKVIDFGLSKKYSTENPVLTERVGTLYSMSPETMKGHYTTKSDIWSIGVCIFMMLSNGDMPFEGKTPKQLVARVLTGDIQFEAALWEDISEEAKNFIQSLLQVDPSDRVSASDAIKDSWFRSKAVSSSDPSILEQDLIEQVQDSIVRYADTGEFRKLALNVIAKKSNSAEIFELRKVFDEFDTLNSGTITLEEFKAALLRFNYSDEEIEIIFRKVDVNRTNVIDYTEFLAATLETQGVIEEYRLSECFDQMDRDDSGYISRENLRDLLGKHSSERFIDILMEEADIKKDGRISYDEFLQVLSSEHRKTVNKMYNSEPLLSIVSEEEAEEARDAEKVLQKHGLLGSHLSTNKLSS